MTRHTRQQGELQRLCAAGEVAHAIDLAFEHFADFGPDAELVAALAQELDHHDVSPAVRARFAELADALHDVDHAAG